MRTWRLMESLYTIHRCRCDLAVLPCLFAKNLMGEHRVLLKRANVSVNSVALGEIYLRVRSNWERINTVMGMTYHVYTDGACANNQAPGGQPGGWACVFVDGESFSGGDAKTTNNRMEMTAVIEALSRTESASDVHIYTDSAYVINAFIQNWFAGWERRGWKNAKGNPVENQDLWQAMRSLVEERRVKWVKVKGHSGVKYNEEADRLAVSAMRHFQ